MTSQTHQAEKLEFFIVAVRGGYGIEVDGALVGGTFETRGAAFDMAGRFAQDTGAARYAIFG